jgi:hypothetical protein
MMTMHTEIDEAKALKSAMEYMYANVGHWSETWKNRIYFNETGLARLGSIAGYLAGLSHAGKDDFARELANDFTQHMEYLSQLHNVVEFDARVKLPGRKVILSDDRCLHSFGFWALQLISKEEFDSAYDKNLETIKNDSSLVELYDGQEHLLARNARQKTIEDLHIVEKVVSHVYPKELTERYYVDGQTRFAYYGRGWNGALIYHGPGSGETFSVVVGSSRTLWSLHS